MASAAPWKESLQRALKKNAASRDSRYVQLATVRPDGRPANRTIVYRGFLAEGDILTFVTDSRSRKIAEVAACPWGEVAWYFPNTREQFRILGQLTIVDSQTQDAALQKGRLVAWKNMSDSGRQQFLWPQPGEQRGDDDSIFKPDPPTSQDPVLDTFCLACLAAEEVDHLQLPKNQRRLYVLKPPAVEGMPIPGLPFPDEQLFTSLNCCLPAWLLLMLAPRWRFTMPLVCITASIYAALYVALIAHTIMEGGSEKIDMFSFDGVARLLSTRSAVLPAWVHYIVFDLWTARWEVLDSLNRGVPQILMALPLFFTCMLGPAGLLIYLYAIRPWFAPLATPRVAGKYE
ncbi:hypothetical protein D9Q98_004869 [Chlorella vulgaris]|uniref:Pyridoxamine 5'-phosphate oxidase Alr4036 family FMN-binding domain-containing protein n=1 Tax=Chlorella vulgaris TaxID=3077 RepID=A0A9D4YWN2_CHLVU|nr:hypothetical protein D9Q98_004869 [Chlorella vulgaris]